MSCPSCGSDVPSGARFCPTCGHLLVETEERRVVTVLFADLVGFTSLGEDADPEDLKHLIDTCFQRLVADVGAFGGTVDKIIGDAILALFGAPVAHEDDPERALRTAFRMRRSLKTFSQERGIELQMRTGINTGEVLVGALHAGGDYTVMGDTVNIASRLQDMASPGEVLVGSATQAATASVVRYESRGEIGLRGRSEPVGVFAASGELAPPGRRRTAKRAPLIGRHLELQQLTSAINTAVIRGRAQLVQIVGEAGVGKSRLAEEVATQVEADHGAVVLSSMVLPYDETNPLRAIGDAIASASGVSHNDSTAVAGEQIKAMVSKVVADQSSAGAITSMVLAMLGRVPSSTSLVAFTSTGTSTGSGDFDAHGASSGARISASSGARISASSGAHISDSNLAESVSGIAVSGIAELFEALVKVQPVVLMIGDIHWADERLLALLESLLGELASQPFVVLTTARWAVDEKRWTVPPGRHNNVTINLDPLDVAATAELANALLGFEAPPELIEQLHTRSGGNPFFLEEISTLLRDAGVVGVDAVPARAASPLSDLPDTLRGLVAARLDSLTDEERKMVDDAAVLGSGGSITDLLTSTGLGVTSPNGTGATGPNATGPNATGPAGHAQPGVAGVEHADSLFHHLIDKDIFDVEKRTWRFRSDLVREVAYSRLTKAERAQRHIRVAEWMAEGIDEKPAEYVSQVANHLATAIELGASPNKDVPWSTSLGTSIIDAAIDWLARAGEHAVARESPFAADQLYRRAIELLGDDDPRLIAMSLGRAKARLGLGEISGARADAESARALALAKGDRDAAAQGMLLQGRIAITTDEHAQAESLLAEASAMFQSLGNVRDAAEALRLRGFALLRSGDHSRADRYINEAHATFVHLKDKSGVAWCLQSLAWLSFEQGLIKQAAERLQLAIETFTEEDNKGGLATARGLQAFLLFHSGERPKAAQMAAEVRSVVRERGERFTESMMDLLLGSIGLWSGQADDALKRARAAEQVFTQIGSAFGVVQALGLQGRAYVALGKVQQSRAVLAECLQRAKGMPGQPLEQFAETVRAGASVQIGDPQAALEDIKSAVQARDIHGPLVIGTLELGVSEGLALLQLGQVDEAIKVLEGVDDIRAADHEASSMYLDSSLALAYCAAGQTSDAQDLAQAVLGNGSGTYLDVRTALLAQALVHARNADRAAMDEVFTKALKTIDETDSRFSQAIVRLARSIGHETIEQMLLAGPEAEHEIGPETEEAKAEETRAETEEALRKLDVRPSGWETALCLAAGMEAPHLDASASGAGASVTGTSGKVA